MKGVKSGKVRKIALIRVEHEGEYALVASYGGAPDAPGLVPQPEGSSRRRRGAGRPGTLRRHGPRARRRRARRLVGAAVAVFNYAEYQAKTDRQIPVLIASPR